LKTPDRYAKALMFFTRGYEQNIRGWYMHHICIYYYDRVLISLFSFLNIDVVNEAVFEEGEGL
jgi:GTP cyclohydrolase I